MNQLVVIVQSLPIQNQQLELIAEFWVLVRHIFCFFLRAAMVVQFHMPVLVENHTVCGSTEGAVLF